MRLSQVAWGCNGCEKSWRIWRFRVLNPEGRASIIRRFITLQKETGDVIHRITGDMRHELEKAGIDAEVFGRAKKPYSIWRKMQEKEIGFSRLSDIYGFRIITRSKAECYATLGVIHQRWARDSRALQGLHQRTQIKRLSVDSHNCFRP